MFSNFWGVERASAQKKSCDRLKLAEKSIFKIKHFLIAFFKMSALMPYCNASTFEFPSLGDHLHLAQSTFKEQAEVGPKSLIFSMNDHQLIYSKASFY